MENTKELIIINNKKASKARMVKDGEV